MHKYTAKVVKSLNEMGYKTGILFHFKDRVLYVKSKEERQRTNQITGLGKWRVIK